jgi:ubiquitin C-terminal hydrolase
LKIGRQEDAHEFLLYFLSAMENSSRNYVSSITKKFTKIKKNPASLIDDNLIQKIFGGTLISSVTCGRCKKSSNKLDKFIDISLV